MLYIVKNIEKYTKMILILKIQLKPLLYVAIKKKDITEEAIKEI